MSSALVSKRLRELQKGLTAMERMSGRRRPMKRLNFKISNDSVVIDDDKQNCSKYQVSKPKQNEK